MADEVLHLKRPEKTKLAQTHSFPQIKPKDMDMHCPSLNSPLGPKKSMKNEPSPSVQQSEYWSIQDTLLDSSGSKIDYRALRHKYLILEEDSFLLAKELNEVEAEVKSLEDEKLALLDKLVVLEGLIDPSEIQPNQVF